MRQRSFRRGWLTPAAAAIGEPGLTPHEFRHTAASLAIPAGANVKAVRACSATPRHATPRLASAEVTLNVYIDPFDDDLDHVAMRLDHVVSR